MLSWPPGPRSSDGVWAPHWYDRVWRSTGFVAVPPGPPPDLDPALEPLLEQCLPYYEKLRENKIKVDIPNEGG
jgi:Sulfotransferase domain